MVNNQKFSQTQTEQDHHLLQDHDEYDFQYFEPISQQEIVSTIMSQFKQSDHQDQQHESDIISDNDASLREELETEIRSQIDKSLNQGEDSRISAVEHSQIERNERCQIIMKNWTRKQIYTTIKS